MFLSIGADFFGIFAFPIPNPENPELKRSMKYHFFGFSDFLIVLFRIFQKSDYIQKPFLTP
uniref:Uncharacterized protein n=1 Tax=Candidatus Kentrum sp. LPFa TaxID=2126335 RepID=A0A450WGH3_9GAMM|nr:MAG: hypothetical protein BECKLPF1236B_GA0070989_108810 [Candidatus Kentron sp. LPFa]